MPDRGERGASDQLARLWEVGPPPTAHAVLSWFKEAWPNKARYPDLGSCTLVAQGIRSIRSVEEGDKRRKSNLEDEKAIRDVKTGAGVFLKHSPSVLRQLEADLDRLTLQVFDIEGLSTLIIDEKWHQSVSDTRNKLDQARDAMDAALEALKSWSGPYRKADRLLWVQRHMREAWERTDGSCPMLTHEDSPEVLFIKLALDSVNDHRKLESIARAFRPSRAGRRSSLRR